MFETRNPYNMHTAQTTVVMPGDGMEDLDRVLDWMDRNRRGTVRLISRNSGRYTVSKADVSKMREMFIEKYGEVNKPNMYMPLADLEGGHERDNVGTYKGPTE